MSKIIVHDQPTDSADEQTSPKTKMQTQLLILFELNVNYPLEGAISFVLTLYLQACIVNIFMIQTQKIGD